MPYHAIIGVKLIGALVIFFLAIALTGRSAGFDNIRKNGRKWLSVLIVLGLLIVLISGGLHQVRHLSPTRSDSASSDAMP